MIDKKTLKTVILIIILSLLLFISPFIILLVLDSMDPRTGIFLNWHMVLPKYKNVNIVDLSSHVHNFSIYTLFEDREKTIKSLKMAIITDENQNIIKPILDDYYGRLNDDDIEKFNNEIELESLYAIGNYYSCVGENEGSKDYMLLFLSSDNKLYVLEYLT